MCVCVSEWLCNHYAFRHPCTDGHQTSYTHNIFAREGSSAYFDQLDLSKELLFVATISFCSTAPPWLLVPCTQHNGAVGTGAFCSLHVRLTTMHYKHKITAASWAKRSSHGASLRYPQQAWRKQVLIGLASLTHPQCLP